MRALVCEKIGPPEALELLACPEPIPGKGQVRIRVRAAGVNFPDTLIVEGRYHIKAEPPFIPGSEVAGTIDMLGEGVEGWHLQDRVCAMCVTGGFAEFVVVDAARLISLPEAIPFSIGSGLLMTYGTAIHALRQRASLLRGEKMLVLGAGGGVGLAAIAIGAAMGAQVIASASTEAKRDLARKQNAAAAIGIEPEAIRQAGPYDVIFDPVGGTLSETSFRAVATGGRHLVIGFASGHIPRIALNLPLMKSASLVGVFWGAFTTRNPDAHRANMKDVFAMLTSGEMPWPAMTTATLADGPKILRDLALRRIAGKVALIVQSDRPQT